MDVAFPVGRKNVYNHTLVTLDDEFDVPELICMAHFSVHVGP